MQLSGHVTARTGVLGDGRTGLPVTSPGQRQVSRSSYILSLSFPGPRIESLHGGVQMSILQGLFGEEQVTQVEFLRRRSHLSDRVRALVTASNGCHDY